MDKSWDGKATCAKSGEDGFHTMWETSFVCSVVNIGVVDVLVHSPDTLFGMETHILPAAGVVDGYKISAEPLLGIALN